MAQRQTTPETFWLKVDKEAGPVHPIHGKCWIWNGAHNKAGYGVSSIKKKFIYIHRYAFQLENGPIPEGKDVLHKCDFTGCCCPSHLFLGDDKTNTQDRQDKGRTAKGVGHGRVKLTEGKVKSIRTRYCKGIYRSGAYVLAKEFGVHPTLIKAIIDRKIWKHIE